MTDKEFYQNCAIAAMQGIQEADSKIGIISNFTPSELAIKAFDIADHMLKEYHHRMAEKPYLRKEPT